VRLDTYFSPKPAVERYIRAVRTSDVPAVVAPPPGNPRFALFDGLRAIAALAVVVYHVPVVSEEHHGVYTSLGTGFAYQILGHLDWGVTIFFLISGFLLYRPFVAARQGKAPRHRRARFSAGECCA